MVGLNKRSQAHGRNHLSQFRTFITNAGRFALLSTELDMVLNFSLLHQLLIILGPHLMNFFLRVHVLAKSVHQILKLKK